MRFSDNGYYIERYIKCSNCGVLLYESVPIVGEAETPYCSTWCKEWARLRTSGEDAIRLPLPKHKP